MTWHYPGDDLDDEVEQDEVHIVLTYQVAQDTNNTKLN